MLWHKCLSYLLIYSMYFQGWRTAVLTSSIWYYMILYACQTAFGSRPQTISPRWGGDGGVCQVVGRVHETSPQVNMRSTTKLPPSLQSQSATKHLGRLVGWSVGRFRGGCACAQLLWRGGTLHMCSACFSADDVAAANMQRGIKFSS